MPIADRLNTTGGDSDLSVSGASCTIFGLACWVFYVLIICVAVVAVLLIGCLVVCRKRRLDRLEAAHVASAEVEAQVRDALEGMDAGSAAKNPLSTEGDDDDDDGVEEIDLADITPRYSKLRGVGSTPPPAAGGSHAPSRRRSVVSDGDVSVHFHGDDDDDHTVLDVAEWEGAGFHHRRTVSSAAHTDDGDGYPDADGSAPSSFMGVEPPRNAWGSPTVQPNRNRSRYSDAGDIDDADI